MADRFHRRKQPAAGPRKIVAPELLEPRNAPGAMLTVAPAVDSTIGEPLANVVPERVSRHRTHDLRTDDRHTIRPATTAESQPADDTAAFLLGNRFDGGATIRQSIHRGLRKQFQESRTPVENASALDVSRQLRAEVRVNVSESVTTTPAVEPPRESTPDPAPPVEPPAPAAPAARGSGGGGGGGAASAVAAAAVGSSAGGPSATVPTASTTKSVAPPQLAPVDAATVTSVAETVPQAGAAESNGAAGRVTVTAPIAITPAVQATGGPSTSGPTTIGPATIGSSTLTPDQAERLITADDVLPLLQRAAGATSSDDAIIAIVDRGGRILGVRVEEGVTLTGDTLVFAIDGAVAKARTAAFFSNDQAALTSRTVRFISQTTITEREVESNPNVTDPDSTVRGPGFVAPVGLGSHFPPDIPFTPQVDLVGIEHTNRDSVAHPGPDRIKQEATVDADGNVTGVSGDDFNLGSRFGAPFDAGQEVAAPESYGLVSGMMTEAQSRGVATLPGGIPLYKNGHLVGGIGVFFPGDSGMADHEQNFQRADERAAMDLPPQTTEERTNAPLAIEAEYIALQVALNQETVAGIPPVPGFGTTIGRIDLVGITLETVGPHRGGIDLVQNAGRALGEGNPNSTNTGDESMPDVSVVPSGIVNLDGADVPEGWLVSPRAGGGLTADQVREAIERGIAEANLVRSAIRLPFGQRSRMVLAVTDTDGNVLGLFRMPDSTIFSIDVAVAKARNVAYYADAADLQAADTIDDNNDGNPDVAPGVAFTNRTFRFLSTAFFPSGIDGTGGGPFSILNDPNVNPANAENIDDADPAPASAHTSVLGFDAFNPGSNFREPVTGAASPDPGLQNGIVFFPGSTPVYQTGVLVGGLGISGDGVDQDDVVTFSAAGDMLPRGQNGIIRADQVFVRGIRLPYQKFLRNPHG